MFSKIFYLSFIFLISSIISYEKVEVRIKVDSENKWEIVYSNFSPTEHYVATAYYTDSVVDLGWDKLSIKTNSIFRDEIQAEGAGRLEGALTKDRIYNFYLNLKDEIPINDKIKNFFEEQEKFVYDLVEKGEGSRDPMLYNAYLIKIQYNAMIDQYNKEVSDDKKLNKIDFHLMNYYADMYDVYQKFKIETEGEADYKKMDNEKLLKLFIESTHCSALFKIKNDLSDVFFGHNTWNSYFSAIRIIKEYNFNFNNRWARSKNIIFTSYPATLSSLDDFYITSHGLVAIETTNVLYNDTLYSKIIPNSLFTADRVMICNRIANSSKEWGEYFSKYNSGTYNNQFMILDKNKINLVNKSIAYDAFYVVEQLPGLVKSNNVTDILKFGYWGSYNIPFDHEIYNISGIREVIKEKPELVSYIDYDVSARSKIFRRDHWTTDNLEGFKKILRYNNYTKDPFCENNPLYTISARTDLLGEYCSGAYDAKVGALSEWTDTKVLFHLIGGPTFDENDEEIQPFDWNKAPECCKKHPHNLIPDNFRFDWIEYENDFSFEN